MKVTGWTYWSDEHFKNIDDVSDEIFGDIENAVIEEVRNKGYKFNGGAHQSNYDKCTPVIDNTYKYCVSMRRWGSVMQKAYNLPNEDGLGYVVWAWSNPEKPVYPE